MRHSDLSHLLLGMIRRGPRTGYELRRILKETPLGRFSDSPGSVYPVLERLEAA